MRPTADSVLGPPFNREGKTLYLFAALGSLNWSVLHDCRFYA